MCPCLFSASFSLCSRVFLPSRGSWPFTRTLGWGLRGPQTLQGSSGGHGEVMGWRLSMEGAPSAPMMGCDPGSSFCHGFCHGITQTVPAVSARSWAGATAGASPVCVPAILCPQPCCGGTASLVSVPVTLCPRPCCGGTVTVSLSPSVPVPPPALRGQGWQ